MLAYLEGTIIAITGSGAIIQSGAVGYEVTSSRLATRKPGEKISLYTILHVSSDNQQILLGFESLEARGIYYQLIKVPGVGPRTALRIIEFAPVEALRGAILEGDFTFFTRVKGLGKKNAQKIILELKNTLVESTATPQNQELYNALRSLSFTTEEIDQATRNLDLSSLDEATALKVVLQSLGK